MGYEGNPLAGTRRMMQDAQKILDRYKGLDNGKDFTEYITSLSQGDKITLLLMMRGTGADKESQKINGLAEILETQLGIGNNSLDGEGVERKYSELASQTKN